MDFFCLWFRKICPIYFIRNKTWFTKNESVKISFFESWHHVPDNPFCPFVLRPLHWRRTCSWSCWEQRVCVRRWFVAESPPCRRPRWSSWSRNSSRLSLWPLVMGPTTSAWSKVSSLNSQFFQENQASYCECLWIVCLPYSCTYWCRNQWSGGNAGSSLEWLLLCPVSLPSAPPAGARPLVLPAHVQVPTLFLLQELHIYLCAFLVCLLLRLLCTGEVCVLEIYQCFLK